MQGLSQNWSSLSPEGLFNAIYWNSDKAHVFYSSLSFQLVPTDVCMSNRCQVTAGFVKVVTYTPLENVRCKKWTKKIENGSMCRKHRKCKRKDVCFICD